MSQILTLDNVCFPMTDVPDEVDDLRFAVLDNSNPEDPDYFFIPLIFLESSIVLPCIKDWTRHN